MKLISLEIPEDASDLAGWLEGQLVGPDLSALIAELEAVHGSAPPQFSLDTILGNQREAVLSHGLASLPPDRLRPLLRHPRLLLDLQELTLRSGGPYWRRRAASIQDQAPGAVDRSWAWLAANVIEPLPASSIPIPSAPRLTRPRPRWRSLALSVLSAAAVVIAAFTISQRPEPDRKPNGPHIASSPRWGWSRPDALPQDLPRNAYLNHLADAAHAWFDQRPDDPVALAKRIAEFRRGCLVLIQSPHRPLPVDDHAWLIEKCRAWVTKLDAHLAAIKSGQDTIKVRGEADETINRLIATLRERASGTA